MECDSDEGYSPTSTKRSFDEVDRSSDEISSPKEDDSVKRARVEEDPAKADRLKAIGSLINSLNSCEADCLEQLFDDSFAPNCELLLVHDNTKYYGKNGLLLMWLMTHENFPDGMFKVLESRHVNMTVPRSKQNDPKLAALSPMVEYVFKFSGIRILPMRSGEMMRSFVDKYPDYSMFSFDELSNKVVQLIASSDMSTESEVTTNIIGDGTLTFDSESNLIKAITFNILVADASRPCKY